MYTILFLALVFRLRKHRKIHTLRELLNLRESSELLNKRMVK